MIDHKPKLMSVEELSRWAQWCITDETPWTSESVHKLILHINAQAELLERCAVSLQLSNDTLNVCRDILLARGLFGDKEPGECPISQLMAKQESLIRDLNAALGKGEQ